MTHLIEQINQDIQALAQAERVTKPLLASLSRSVLSYVLIAGEGEGEGDKPSHDIRPVNSLLKVLTTMNKRVAALFFQKHMPFKFDKDAVRFGKIGKANKVEELTALAVDSLADEEYNIWTFSDGIELQPEDKDRKKEFTTAVAKAVKYGVSADDMLNIMQAVIEAAAGEEEAKADVKLTAQAA